MEKFSEQAVIYITDKHGHIDWDSIEAALFRCYCIGSTCGVRTDERRWNEYVIDIRVPVYDEKWESARYNFEKEFRNQPALKNFRGFWSIIHDGNSQWFDSEKTWFNN